LIDRFKPKPKPPPPPQPFQIHIFPKVTWWNLPQRIAEGICVSVIVGILFGIWRMLILSKKGV
jgi:hypothetical protein